ncbi:MAG TPA: hypothetical protein DCZ94_08985 [Lentisphaeria bacterium]|nr:MAG: hypothetical protein A2X48_23420 [Lentisphaerae bacterium GWF2_49_21]HBC87075.1 hypothetical protein [Lentisphaeria bacterium]
MTGIKNLIPLVLGIAAISLWADEKIIEGVSCDSSGVVSMQDGIKVFLAHWSDKWQYSDQKWGALKAEPGYPLKKDASLQVKGIWQLKDGIGSFNTNLVISSVNASSFEYEINLQSQEPVNSRLVCLSLVLPAPVFAGKEIFLGDNKLSLPDKLSGEKISQMGKIHKITIPMKGKTLVIEGDYEAGVFDDRAYKTDMFSIKINLLPSSGGIKESRLKLKLNLIENTFRCIDLKKYANMGFKDDVPDDGKGGWTDQGPANDLSCMKPGLITLCSVPFKIIDPDSNNGKACMVFAGPSRDYFIKEARHPHELGESSGIVSSPWHSLASKGY